MSFVKENEGLLERGQKDKVKLDEKRINQLVRGFSNDWKKSIEELNQDIMHSFTNFKNGTAILQVSLTDTLTVIMEVYIIAEGKGIGEGFRRGQVSAGGKGIGGRGKVSRKCRG